MTTGTFLFTCLATLTALSIYELLRYLVSHQLRTWKPMNRILIAIRPIDPKRTYPDLEKHIKTVVGPDDCFVMPLTAIVRTRLSVKDVGDAFTKIVDPADSFIVAPLAPERWYAYKAKSVDDCFETW